MTNDFVRCNSPFLLPLSPSPSSKRQEITLLLHGLGHMKNIQGTRVYTRTRRYKFINYALNNYQDKITN